MFKKGALNLKDQLFYSKGKEKVPAITFHRFIKYIDHLTKMMECSREKYEWDKGTTSQVPRPTWEVTFMSVGEPD